MLDRFSLSVIFGKQSAPFFFNPSSSAKILVLHISLVALAVVVFSSLTSLIATWGLFLVQPFVVLGRSSNRSLKKSLSSSIGFTDYAAFVVSTNASGVKVFHR